MTPPNFLYGTAWKGRKTRRLTRMAVQAGFRGIDTANQRKHYFEEAVGQALRELWDEGFCSREDLFLQTKFTYIRGQDHRLPYDKRAPLSTQVEQSFESSLEHLHTDTIDAYLLHGPASRKGLTDGDWEVWQAMEKLHDSGRVRQLGVSNVGPDQLSALVAGARVRPSFVQNRCYARRGWDALVRKICHEEQIRYQGFSLLTANRRELARPEIQAIARSHGATVPQVVFAFAMQQGMLPLTGTSSEKHMRQDLASDSFRLSAEECNQIAPGLDSNPEPTPARG
jgi:diketogulonate reductase-like aldo/keto reductase